MKKSKEKRVIPGFKLSLGITIALLSIVVLIPLASLILVSSGIGLKKFISIVTAPEVMAGYKVSFSDGNSKKIKGYNAQPTNLNYFMNMIRYR